MRKKVEFLSFQPGRIVILPVEVAGYSHGLAEGLSKLGKAVTFVELAEDNFNYASSRALPYEVISTHRESPGFFSYLRWLSYRALVAWKISKVADLVVTQFAMGILPLNLDLIFYKLKGVKVVSLAGYGTEARLAQMNHPQTLHKNNLAGHSALAVKSLLQRVRMFFLYKLTDFFFASPQISHLVPGPFFNFLDLGHPLSDETVSLARELVKVRKINGSQREEFRISHVPSAAIIKGTETIRSVIEQLKRKFPHVSYSELSNVSHDQLLTHVAHQDLIIDSLYCDYPFPVTSAEAYLLGVPAVVGGYYSAWPAQFYQNFEPPSVQILPELLYEALEKLVVEGRNKLQENGRAGQKFVRANFGSQQVAARMLAAITGSTSSGVAIMKRSETPYKLGLGGEKSVIEEFTRTWLARLFAPELQ